VAHILPRPCLDGCLGAVLRYSRYADASLSWSKLSLEDPM